MGGEVLWGRYVGGAVMLIDQDYPGLSIQNFILVKNYFALIIKRDVGERRVYENLRVQATVPSGVLGS